ncbi:MAG TPA: MATE family efflux transporter, partial [Allocoleopsis sp.]
LLQIALLSQFTIQGVGMTTQTLIGNFKSKGAIEQLLPVLLVSVLTTLPIALGFAGTTILFPDQVFGILTNHTEVSDHVSSYVLWLLPLLEITAVAFMLEGYFIGLKEGKTLRNAVVMAFGIGFIPLATAGWYWHSNHLLWLSLVAYVTLITLNLGWQLPRTLGQPAASTLSGQET